MTANRPTSKDLLDQGKTDEEVIAYIMEQSGVMYEGASMTLGWVKGENVDDVIGPPLNVATPGSRRPT